MKKNIHDEKNTAIEAGFTGFSCGYGNPPYVKALHLKILELTLEFCQQGGEITAIHPLNWMQDAFYKHKRRSNRKTHECLYRACTQSKSVERVDAARLFNTPFEYDLGINVYENGHDNGNKNFFNSEIENNILEKFIKACGYEGH